MRDGPANWIEVMMAGRCQRIVLKDPCDFTELASQSVGIPVAQHFLVLRNDRIISEPLIIISGFWVIDIEPSLNITIYLRTVLRSGSQLFRPRLHR